MPRCACGAATCACVITSSPEDGIEVRGVGSQANPYRLINLRGDAFTRLTPIDTDTVDLTFTNLNPGDPNAQYTLQADATVSLSDLTDVDGADPPDTGDSIIWDGTQWVFAPAAAGGAPVSGIWGTAPLDKYGVDPLAGRTTYVDTNGQIRAAPLEVSAVQAPALDGNSPPTAWPVGSLTLTVTVATGTTWPGLAAGLSGSGTVYTLRRVGDVATAPVVHQWFYATTNTLNGHRIFYRSAAGDPSIWSPWRDTLAGGTFGERNYVAARGHAAATSIPHAGSGTVVPFDTLVLEDGITSSAGLFTVPVAGYYSVDVVLTYAWVNMTGVRSALIFVNSAQGASVAGSPIQSQASSVSGSQTVLCAAGDVISVRAYQSSGAALALSGNQNYNRVSIAKVPAPVVNGSAASGVWGVGPWLDKMGPLASTLGNDIYVDSNGQLRARPGIINTGTTAPTETPDYYPIGTTVTTVGTAAGASWPVQGSCTVVTFKRADTPSIVAQWCFANSPSRSVAWYRNGQSATWAPWAKAADTFANDSVISGTATVVFSGTASATVAVTFPAGVFAASPNIIASARSSRGFYAYVSSGLSKDGATLSVYTIDKAVASGSFSIDWIATGS
jgi:hypothetical protein